MVRITDKLKLHYFDLLWILVALYISCTTNRSNGVWSITRRTVVYSISEWTVRPPLWLSKHTRPFVPPGYVNELRAGLSVACGCWLWFFLLCSLPTIGCAQNNIKHVTFILLAYMFSSVQCMVSYTRSSAIAVIADRTACSILTLFIAIATSRPLNKKKSVRCQSADPTITADLRPQSAVRTLCCTCRLQSCRSRHRVIVDKRAVPFR